MIFKRLALPILLLWATAGTVAALPCESLNRINLLNHWQFSQALVFSNLAALRCSFESSLEASKSFSDRRRYQGGVNAGLFNFEINLRFERAERVLKAVPRDFSAQVFLWQRAMVKAYLGTVRLLKDINPWPGLTYYVVSRSPAFPYVYMSTIEDISYNLRTIPFLDDQKIKLLSNTQASYGAGITLTLF